MDGVGGVLVEVKEEAEEPQLREESLLKRGTSKMSRALVSRVSQKNQKSEFCFATNPSGFHKLDEPPEKISAL